MTTNDAITPQTARTVRIIGVPMDLGQSRRGVDMGPSAVRYAGLQARMERLGYVVHDCGNIDVPVVEEIAERDRLEDDANARHLNAIVHVCELIYKEAIDCVGPDDLAIFLGGDHSMSVGSVSGISAHHPVGVLWIDAHADYNTPQSSPSGNVHGMPMAALLGDGPRPLAEVGRPGPKLQPSQVAMIGIRNLDAAERRRLTQSGISIYTMSEIDEHGIAAVTRRALDRLNHLEAFHVSLDMDSLDPDVAPGVGTPVRGGLTYREAHLLMELLAESGKVRSLDIVEINPILDHRNQTAELAVDLAASLLGQRIL
jgi:arginase